MNTLTFKKNPCPICGNPNNTIWDYCLKCEKELGFACCQRLEKIKKKGMIKQTCKCSHPIDDHVPDMECLKCDCLYYEQREEDANKEIWEKITK